MVFWLIGQAIGSATCIGLISGVSGAGPVEAGGVFATAQSWGAGGAAMAAIQSTAMAGVGA